MKQRQDFPEYSMALYGRGNVEASCLRLQDEYGLDVNVVLFCYWFGAHHGVIDAGLWQRIEAISGQWQSQLIRPLREARRWLKDPGFDPDLATMELRERIKQDEITAELLQQQMMQEACEGVTAGAPDTPAEAARCNARALLESNGTAMTREIDDLLAEISTAAFS